ncbi:SEC-C motif-containing protein [Duganella sp. 3397]|uniref:YchJ family protein n=1 Tax=Duganella sp. 3397 TaxID=2817732 RepID=UPI0028579C23|nr:YchJ family metal-binding protein [Duganella sp. 3397]MDR7047729.1 SEC-C motif-containing protein [Duganella sp. 3397]
MSKKSPASAGCPCGGPALATCCGPYIEGAAIAPTAEALMRSRYTAYGQRNEPYLLATWHASTRPTEPLFGAEEKLHWLGLEVKSSLRLRQRKAEHADEERDTVEFVARFKVGGRAERLHEVSNFVREADPADGALRWFYVDGHFPQ